MASITMERSYDAPPDVVWAVLTDHDLYAAVAPNLASVSVVEGEAEGMVRRCVDTDGNAWTESCRRWEDGRGFAVAVDVAHSDFHRRLFDRFEGSWDLDERGDDVLVTMRFDYDTRYGPLGWLVSRYVAYRAPAIGEAIFDGWEAAIRSRLEDSREAAAPGEPRRREGQSADPGRRREPDPGRRREPDPGRRREPDPRQQAAPRREGAPDAGSSR